MSDHLKYVIVDWHESPILFPPTMEHREIVRGHADCRAAGMCDLFIDDGEIKVQCWGESLSLAKDFPDGCKSRPQDASIIRRAVNPY